MIKNRIRVIALGLIYNPETRSFLLDWHFDRLKGVGFFRPIGGGVEFGESLEAAVKREFYEEIGHRVDVSRFLGTFENLFEFEGEAGHEIVFAYEVTPHDPTLYSLESLPVCEGAAQRVASWLGQSEVANSLIYPPQFKDLMIAFA